MDVSRIVRRLSDLWKAYAALPFPMPNLLAISFHSCGLRAGVVFATTSVKSLVWSAVRVLSAILKEDVIERYTRESEGRSMEIWQMEGTGVGRPR